MHRTKAKTEANKHHGLPVAFPARHGQPMVCVCAPLLAKLVLRRLQVAVLTRSYDTQHRNPHARRNTYTLAFDAGASMLLVSPTIFNTYTTPSTRLPQEKMVPQNLHFLKT